MPSAAAPSADIHEVGILRIECYVGGVGERQSVDLFPRFTSVQTHPQAMPNSAEVDMVGVGWVQVDVEGMHISAPSDGGKICILEKALPCFTTIARRINPD